MQQLNADEAQRGIDITLYDRYASTVFAYLYQQVSSQQDAEDLLLEVFMAAHNSETFFGITTKRQLAWLRRVARNKVVDRYRHATPLRGTGFHSPNSGGSFRGGRCGGVVMLRSSRCSWA